MTHKQTQDKRRKSLCLILDKESSGSKTVLTKNTSSKFSKQNTVRFAHNNFSYKLHKLVNLICFTNVDISIGKVIFFIYGALRDT